MAHPRQITTQRTPESLQSIDHANIAVAITSSLLDLTAHISELSLTHKASLNEEPESLLFRIHTLIFSACDNHYGIGLPFFVLYAHKPFVQQLHLVLPPESTATSPLSHPKSADQGLKRCIRSLDYSWTLLLFFSFCTLPVLLLMELDFFQIKLREKGDKQWSRIALTDVHGGVTVLLRR
jgi:hypothetical protein